MFIASRWSCTTHKSYHRVPPKFSKSHSRLQTRLLLHYGHLFRRLGSTCKIQNLKPNNIKPQSKKQISLCFNNEPTMSINYFWPHLVWEKKNSIFTHNYKKGTYLLLIGFESLFFSNTFSNKRASENIIKVPF